jgi:hypothetical protein
MESIAEDDSDNSSIMFGGMATPQLAVHDSASASGSGIYGTGSSESLAGNLDDEGNTPGSQQLESYSPKEVVIVTPTAGTQNQVGRSSTINADGQREAASTTSTSTTIINDPLVLAHASEIEHHAKVRHRGELPSLGSQEDYDDDDDFTKVLPFSRISGYEKKLSHYQEMCVREGEKVKLVYLLASHLQGCQDGDTIAKKLADQTRLSENPVDVMNSVKETSIDGKQKKHLNTFMTAQCDFLDGKLYINLKSRPGFITQIFIILMMHCLIN